MPRSLLEAADAKGGALCPNVTFLGHRGVLTTTSGLRIAYLSGTHDPTQLDPTDPVDNPSATRYSKADVDALIRTAKGARGGFAGVDVLLTADWPRGVTRLAPIPEGATATTARAGTDPVADLARELRPRYHFAAQEPLVYYERPPYRNLPLMIGRAIHVTRFFGTANEESVHTHTHTHTHTHSPTTGETHEIGGADGRWVGLTGLGRLRLPP
jgi:hypothetical protein